MSQAMMVLTAKMNAAGEPTAAALAVAKLVNQLLVVGLRGLAMGSGMRPETLQLVAATKPLLFNEG